MDKKITPEELEKAKQTIIAYENQEFKEAYPDGFPCICCDTKIKPIDPEYIRRPESGMYHDGIVDKVSGGYGSKHDTEMYIIAICDPCLDRLKAEKKLLYAGNYMGMY